MFHVFSNLVKKNRSSRCPELLFVASASREIDSVNVALRAVEHVVSALHFACLLSDFDEIRHNKHVQVMQLNTCEFRQVRAYYACRRYTCTVKPYGVSNVKNAWTHCVHSVTQYAIDCLAVLSQQQPTGLAVSVHCSGPESRQFESQSGYLTLSWLSFKPTLFDWFIDVSVWHLRRVEM